MVPIEDILDSEDKFKSKLIEIPNSSCITLRGYIGDDGYVQFQFNHNGIKRNVRAHRAAYILNTGEDIKPEDVIMHLCDNPVCVNIKHLSKGTHQDNMSDMVSKDRQAKGIGNGQSVLVESEVIEIFKDIKSSSTALARRFDVDRKTITAIQDGKTWTHITDKEIKKERGR